jgi:hypothetical protein
MSPVSRDTVEVMKRMVLAQALGAALRVVTALDKAWIRTFKCFLIFGRLDAGHDRLIPETKPTGSPFCETPA